MTIQYKSFDSFAFKYLCSLSFFSFKYIFQNSHVSYMHTHTHTHSYRSSSTPDLIANNSTIADYYFEYPINQAKEEGEEDCEIPG